MNFFYLPILWFFLNVLSKYAYPNLDRNEYVMDAIYLVFVRWGKMEMKNKNSCRGVIFMLSVARVLFAPFRPPWLKGSFLSGRSKEII